MRRDASSIKIYIGTANANRFARVWQEADLKTDPASIFQQLVSLYSESHRHYHNLRHMNECLAEFDSARQVAREPLSVELAIWFHDAIYETHARDNEERSAELARRCISDGGGAEKIRSSVETLIMATKTHDSAIHPDAPLMVDIDLSILGKSEERFDQYETQIQREYDWVPREVFAAKRAEILESFAARDRIYATEHFFALYEQKARSNLERSVKNLKG